MDNGHTHWRGDGVGDAFEWSLVDVTNDVTLVAV